MDFPQATQTLPRYAACSPSSLVVPNKLVYLGNVMLRCSLQSHRGALSLALLLTFLAGSASAKSIRLRNEVISPTAQGPIRLAAPTSGAAATSPVNGLYLVQFETVPDAAARADLSAAGVELVQFVPEDAFVVRLRNVSLAQVRSIPGVTWASRYLPRHKIHQSLSAPTKQAVAAPRSVAILLARDSDASEVGVVQRSLADRFQDSVTSGGRVLRGRVTQTALNALAESEAVLWIEPDNRMKLFDEVSSKLVAGDGGPGELLTRSLGYDGEGVTVAVADSGLHNGDADSMHPDLLGRTPAFFAYGGLPDAADEHSHGTHVAGIIAGNAATGEVDENGALYGLGVAPGASIIGQRIFDGAGNYYAPPSYEKMTRDALGAGADIGSNSWGDDTQGRYDLSAMEFDGLVRDANGLQAGDQQYILEFSAGNAGPGVQTIGSPAVGKNVIATGASQNDRLDFIIYGDGVDAMADFSSRGPCEDGRIKPDVVAPGTWIASLQSASATDVYAWTPISPNYQYQGGTSQAGPHASGAAAIFVQYYRATHAGLTPSPALVKGALINSAYDLFNELGTTFIPNMDEGWGAIDLTYLFEPALTFSFTDQTQLLAGQQAYEQTVLVAGNDWPLRITLTYTDVPGFPGAIPALVNDLDLQVIGPDGTVYKGNQFVDGESVPNPNPTDTINNVEAVYLGSPVPGDYRIRVVAKKVAQDARTDTPAIDQDFALVVSAVQPTPGVATVNFDRPAYTVPADARVIVIDPDAASESSLTVRVNSTSEPGGEDVTLSRASLSGSFTGMVATALAPAASDGRLQMSNGDTLTATYFDASAGMNRTTTAVADLVGPAISNVIISNEFGRVIVGWSTSEAARSVVRLGTNNTLVSLTSAVTNHTLTTEHGIELEGLTPGLTYYFYVVSADVAGNSTTNSNGGNFFSFVVPATPPVLLVHGRADLFDLPDISGYLAALDAVAVPYDLWDLEAHGSPSEPVLSRYRAVIWRVPEWTAPWTGSERATISNYVHNGGGLLVSSMEALSRLEEEGAGSFIRDVLKVESFTSDTGVTHIVGTDNDALGNGMNTPMDYQAYEEAWEFLLVVLPSVDLSDSLTPAAGASPILRNEFDDIVGLRAPGIGQQGSGRVVFLSFPLDAVPQAGGENDRTHLLRNILSFLAPGIAGLATLSLDSSSYTVPARVLVELGDADAAGQGTIQINVATDSESHPLPITLTEGLQPGVFQGFFALIATNSNPGPNEARAKEGDRISVTYSDPAHARELTTTATIDTIAPGISNPEAEPDYEQAYVYWDTTEPADALVQFGESILLGRTAYAANYSTLHGVQLTGLVPNRTYYYQVVSRDVAGNTRTDNNNGQFYTFKTLAPLLPPWSDNMDGGGTNWSVYSVEDTQAEWRLGVPNNGDVNQANSPPNAWGSNLDGGAIDWVETFLISPAIHLTNGNTAALNFSHSYDFTERTGFEIEFGELSIVTSDSSKTVSLAAYSDASGGWYDEHVDLTPYLGKVVYFTWHYILFSLEPVPRPGWVIDDVSVTVASIARGSVIVTNNLSQASFSVSGPAAALGSGHRLTLTNAPPGEYVVEFASVPFYSTPPAQTKTLAAGGTITFVGEYVMPDSNANGMSDTWETAVFGSIDPGRDSLADTDEDGMTDYAEFIAGTQATNAASALVLSSEPAVVNSSFTVTWPGAPGRSYRVESSANGVWWQAETDWLRSTGSGFMHQTLTAPATSRLFRLRVAP